MIYTDSTKKALRIMCEKHAGQKDKSGLPYLLHPFHVAEQMDEEDGVAAALLHDVVEDTGTTFEELEQEGFPKRVLDALRLLTHKDGVDYYEYVKEIAKNDLARKVKIADLEHNMDLGRLDEIRPRDLERIEKYKKCHDYLCGKRPNLP